MTIENKMERYSVITGKNPREIVLLRGSGCKWRRCRFCDYHLDFSKDETANFALNSAELFRITGVYHHLEVINSGSFIDLDADTLSAIKAVCTSKSIKTIHFECHWQDRSAIKALREDFDKIGVDVKVKIGVETFDPLFRESYLDKGIDEANPAKIAEEFDECCLLFGIPGQTKESMECDIKTGLANFERVCINIMAENSKPIKPDFRVREIFAREILPKYEANPRVDILMENTDFGVGGEKDDQRTSPDYKFNLHLLGGGAFLQILRTYRTLYVDCPCDHLRKYRSADFSRCFRHGTDAGKHSVRLNFSGYRHLKRNGRPKICKQSRKNRNYCQYRFHLYQSILVPL